MVKLPWYFMFAFIVCWPAAVFGQPTLRWKHQDGSYIYLLDKPCTEPAVLQWLKPDWHAKYKASDVVLNGDPLKMCWMPFPEEKIVFFVWQDGSNGPMPESKFRADLGI